MDTRTGAWIWIAALMCLGSTAGYAQGADESGVASKLIALERVGKLQAWQSKDVKTLDAMCDDAFVYVDSDGRVMTKPEVLAYIQRVDSLQFVAEEMTVELHGDTAIVTGLYRMKGVERGKPFGRRGRFVDTWLHKNGRWVAIASLLTPGAS
jgi:ketosteroid isomerase-like protein